jgi:hypothetical protein
MKPWWLYKIGKGILIAVVAATVFGFAVMLLWNALIPDLFHGPVLTFWEALGLLVLSHILFRGWGRPSFHRTHNGWKKRLEAKLAAMTPEEREKFQREWKERCGWYPGMEEHSKEQTSTL